MTKREFSFVQLDVFTSRPLEGNQLAVFLDAAGILMTGNIAHRAPVSVLAFDLDHFKSINDRFGHKTGDAVLSLFAKVVRKTMRASDVVGRIGGRLSRLGILFVLDLARPARAAALNGRIRCHPRERGRRTTRR